MTKKRNSKKARQILDYLFKHHIGGDTEPPDRVLAEWSDACHAASASLLALIRNDAVREQELSERDELAAEVIRKTSAVLECVEAGEIEALDENHRYDS